MYEWTKFREEAGVMRGSTAAEWFGKLRELGVDVDKAFPDTEKLIAHAESFNRASIPNVIDVDRLKSTLQGELGRGEISIEDIVTRLSEASQFANVKADVREVIGKAQHIAYNQVFSSLNKPDDELVALLRPLIATAVEEFTQAVHGIPSNVHSQAELHSTDRRVQKAWLDCEEALDRLGDIYALTEEWRRNGLLSVNGREGETNYHPEDFRWGDVAAMDSPMYRGSAGIQREHRISWFRRMLPLGPTLLTVEEVDNYRERNKAGSTSSLINA